MSLTGNAPLFVVGMPRSGTKLLRELFKQHPDLYIPSAETNFFGQFAAHFAKIGRAPQPSDLPSLRAKFAGEPYFHFRKAYAPDLTPELWEKHVEDWSLAGIYEAIIRSEGPNAAKAPIWGDKSPKHIECLPELDRHFGNPRIVHIVRDSRDQALSSHRSWGKSMKRAAWRWDEQVVAASDYLAARSGPCAECRYEDLVADPGGTMADLCAKIGMAFHPDMGSPAGVVENLGDTKGKTKVSSSNVRKFEKHLTEGEVRRLSELSFRGLQRHAYDPCGVAKTRGPTIGERVAETAHDALRIFIQKRHMR